MIEPVQWQVALKEVASLKDRQGTPIDKEIIETVAMLRLLGFHTTMSCGGHADRVTGGPYVMFRSSKAEEYSKQLQRLSADDMREKKALQQSAIRENLSEQQGLFVLLEKFYDGRMVNFGSRLTLRQIGASANRLYCQGAEIALITDVRTRERMLEENRAEMVAFTEYLKEMYL